MQRSPLRGCTQQDGKTDFEGGAAVLLSVTIHRIPVVGLVHPPERKRHDNSLVIRTPF
jgi:hypothetical protein